MEKKERTKAVTKDLIGHHIKDVEYPIQEYIVQLADDLARRMKNGEKLPFTKFYPCDIDNPLALGQPPITFEREVVATAMCGELLESPEISKDAKERAKYYLSQVEYPGAIGAYSDGPGLSFCIEGVRRFLENRDQCATTYDHIFLMHGVANAASTLLEVVIAGPQDAVSQSNET